MARNTIGILLLQEIDEVVALEYASGDEFCDFDAPIQFDSHGRRHHIADLLWSHDGSYDGATCDRSYTEPHTQQILERKDIQRQVRFWLRQLHPREEAVLKLRFGIGHEDGLTCGEIGEMFNLSCGRISQIEREALFHLAQLFEQHARWVEQYGFSPNQIKQARERLTPRARIRKEPEPEILGADILRRLDRSKIMPQSDKQLLRELFGWGGVQRKDFETIAAERGMSERDLAHHVNQFMRRLRRLGIWSKAPVYDPKKKTA